MAEVSVVIPTRDRSERLRAQLASVLAQDGPAFEVVVVDDGSADDTAAACAEAGGVRYVRRAVAGGPAAARNSGWRAASGALIVFSDDDCVARPGWLAALQAAHARDPEAVIQGRTEPDPRELLELLGGFDEAFPYPAGEDTDLGWRAVEAGRRVVYEPAALNWHAVHVPGAIGMVRASQRWRTTVRNVARHPGLRGALHRGVFWKPSHERLLLGVAGLALARRAPGIALAAALPYLAIHRASHGSLAGTAIALPAHAAVDAAEIVAMVRGSASARTLVL
jgi:glycosyltransferase involved in cell wall biosynthesis